MIRVKSDKYSVSKILREQNRSNDFFELMIANISIEELIALKLEIAFRTVPTPIAGLPIWKAMPKISRDAVMKFAFATAGTKKGAMRILGMNAKEFKDYLRKVKFTDYYNKKEKGDVTN